jgi:PAS domain S-box-containing protein
MLGRALLVPAILVAILVTEGLPARAEGPNLAEREYLITTWQTDDGLPESTVTGMVQTPDGYLWIGTFNGLARFDGVSFTVFNRATTPELLSPEIVNLHLDRTGRLWISTTQGMASVKDGQWRDYRHGSGWVGDYVRAFAESTTGELYAANFDGSVVRLRGDAFEALPPPPCDPLLGVFPNVDLAGTLWVVAPKFIGRFVHGTWESVIPIATWKDDLLLGAVRSHDGDLWVVTRGWVRKYRGAQLVFQAPGPGAVRGAWQVYEDSAGAVWVCSDSAGLYRFTREAGWRRFGTDDGLVYNGVRAIFEDREANLWVGTSGAGLQRLRKRIFNAWGVAQGLRERIVKTVAENRRGDILLGTHGQGVVRVEQDGVHSVELPGQQSAPYVYSLLVDNKDRLWVGSYRDGLHVVEGNSDRVFNVDQDGSFRPFRRGDEMFVFSLFQDSRSRIWIGSQRGLSVFDGGAFKTYLLPAVTALHSVRAIAEDPLTGAIWAGYHGGGLYRVANDRLAPVAEARELARDAIAALRIDRDGTVWAGTEDRGLACLRDGRLTRITERHGLPAPGIAAILDDGLGSLWLGSNRGVVRVARQDLEDVVNGRKPTLDGQVFDTNDGLPTWECSIDSQPSAIRDRQGRLWFGTSRGVGMVDPRSLKLNTMPPPIVIEEVKVDGVRVGGSEPFNTTHPRLALVPISVPPGGKRIEIHYTGLSFQAPEKVRFRYLVEGLDKDWNDVGNRRVAYLQDVEPGRYQFRVKAANNDGIWSEGETVMAFTVRPFLWQTWWLRTLVLVGLVSATALVASRVVQHRLQVRIERLEQQKALAREQARLASVLETTSDLVAFCDALGELLYLNPAGRRMLGIEPGADLGGRKLVGIHPQWAAERVTREGIPAAMSAGLWSGETALVGSDGREVPLSQVIAVHRTADGTVEFFSTIARDISERKRAGEELLRRERQLAEAQQIAHLGSWEWDLATDTVRGSEELYRVLGLPPREGPLAGEAFRRHFHPADRERWVRAADETVATGRSLNFESRILRPDGSQREVLIKGEIHRAGAGQTPRLVATTLDITEMRQAEQRIREQAALLDEARDAIMVRDLEGRIRFWNKGAERLYGWTAAEAVGRDAARLFLRAEGSDLRDALCVTLEKGAWSGELPALTRDGRAIVVEGRWTLVRDPTGHPSSLLVIDADITAKKKFESQLLRAQRMESIGTLAGGIAHDLNNVLTPIVMATEMLEATVTDDRGRWMLTTLQENAQRGADMVRQILTFARGVDGERITLQPRHLVRDLEKIARETFPKAIRVSADIPADLWPLCGDATQLHQVLLNLCVNARDAMPHGGTLSITGYNVELDEHDASMDPDAAPGRYVILRVSDTGTGMAAEVVERIFEPFFTTKEVGQGTGLGLSTSLAIVKSHGGFFSVRSEIGQGTTFNVYLPATAESVDEPEVPVERVDLPRGHGELIVVVDDEGAIREMARETLESCGYRVQTAGDGAEAVALYSQSRGEVAVVVTDMRMPLMDGPATIRALRKLNPRVKVIATSGLKDGVDDSAALGSIHAFLQKPYTAERLLATLKRVLAAR